MSSKNCNGMAFSAWTFFCIAREGVTRFWVIFYVITPCNDGYIIVREPFSYPRNLLSGLHARVTSGDRSRHTQPYRTTVSPPSLSHHAELPAPPLTLSSLPYQGIPSSPAVTCNMWRGNPPPRNPAMTVAGLVYGSALCSAGSSSKRKKTAAGKGVGIGE